MADLTDRLRDLGPSIANICPSSNAAGVSYGVLHHGEVIHTAGYGYRDVEARLPPDENTIYHILSLSKSSTALAGSYLISKFDWTGIALSKTFCQDSGMSTNKSSPTHRFSTSSRIAVDWRRKTPFGCRTVLILLYSLLIYFLLYLA